MKVPLIISEPPPEFGVLLESPEFLDPNVMDADVTYVPGYSEARLARDRAIVEVMQGRRAAKDVPTLPAKLRWERCQNKKGEADNRPVIQAGNNGYRAVTKADIGEGKIVTSMPPGAEVQVDGTIRLGDTLLMVTDAQRAARNELQQRARTASASRGAEAGFAEALEAMGGKSKGSAPFISKEVGHRVRAELAPKQKAKEV